MTRRVCILAGEPSGDRLGGALMTAMQRIEPCAFTGVGGMDMTAAGLRSIFDMTDLTVMGIAEVLPRLPTILRRIRQASDHVIATRPDVLLTIDSPDFTLRVAARARKALPGLRVVHYVAPSVWAWRPGRAARMARHVDHVLALLPFEPPYMEAAGMTCDFVGHPVAARAPVTASACAGFRDRHGLGHGPLLLLAPGSRRGEVRRLMPDFMETIARLRAQDPGLGIVCPVAETVVDPVREALGTLDPAACLILPSTDPTEKLTAFAAADAALCASGTITLELAAAGTPMVAAYRTNWLTAQILRQVVRVNTANLVNLVSGTDAVPEFLQEHCTPTALASALGPLLADPGARAGQCAAFETAMRSLGRGGPDPAERAARSVLDQLGPGRDAP